MKRNFELWRHRAVSLAVCLWLSLFMCCGLVPAQSNSSDQFELNDSHFHLTNYIQEGTNIHDFLKPWVRESDAWRYSASPCNRSGRTRIPVTSLRLTTCRRMHRSTTTPSPMPILRWRTGRYRSKSGNASIR